MRPGRWQEVNISESAEKAEDAEQAMIRVVRLLRGYNREAPNLLLLRVLLLLRALGDVDLLTLSRPLTPAFPQNGTVPRTNCQARHPGNFEAIRHVRQNHRLPYSGKDQQWHRRFGIAIPG
jgi:hypothetical protein